MCTLPVQLTMKASLAKMGRKSASTPSGITRVGDNRGSNWGCHPSIFSWKSWLPFLVVKSVVSPQFIFSWKTDDLFYYFFCSSLLLIIDFTRVSPLEGVTPHLFYMSDLVSPIFFVNLPTKIFFQVSPPWRVSPGWFAPLVTPLSTTHRQMYACHCRLTTGHDFDLCSLTEKFYNMLPTHMNICDKFH